MPDLTPYMPESVFSREDGEHRCVPRVLIAPSRYIQGSGILDHLGHYLSIVPSKRAAVLLSAGGQRRDGARLSTSLRRAGVDAEMVTFRGECSREEVERVVILLRSQTPAVDCVVAVGGGKCVDAGKAIAWRLDVPVAICPSLASNDAPCSALSIMYTPEGVYADIEYFPRSPALVAVDTLVVAQAPVRYLVAGMGDAMATWYEARTCLQNPAARSVLGARPTLAANAIGEVCASTLFEHGTAAVEAVQRQEVTDALERIIEANTLLSGIGFESGGLAGAHAVATGLTVVPVVESRYLHGEMVAMGLLTQLVFEDREEEAKRVAKFFAAVGLPIHLGQLSLDADDGAELRDAMETALTLRYARNEPRPVTVEGLLVASRQADALGRQVAQGTGEAAYRALHG
jgi:glycerol dehydrogenase